ncbi:MAG: hypothetical protein CVU90_10360 [Firmicutes bacterium HGW-Firmicutes-15]|nr:MAG: hypothetical protein CVU90_10360 [Firmicutes bacterium HGW-Firmicutes-15]
MNHKIIKKSRLLSIVVLAVLGCLLMALPVLAAGDGSGGGQGVPLGLDSSIPSDGQKDVPLTGDIKLTFNKNVIFLGIRDANKTCFSLIASDGSKVPIEVIMADDQTTEGFEKRRDISIRPVQKLQPGTAYVVKVSPQLQAKNGMSLGHEVTVNFITAGVAPKPVEPAPAPVPVADPGKTQVDDKQPTPITTDTTPNITSESSHPVVEKAPTPTPTVEEKKTEVDDKLLATEPVKTTQSANRTYALVAGLVLIAGMGYIYSRKRTGK